MIIIYDANSFVKTKATVNTKAYFRILRKYAKRLRVHCCFKLTVELSKKSIERLSCESVHLNTEPVGIVADSRGGLVVDAVKLSHVEKTHIEAYAVSDGIKHIHHCGILGELTLKGNVEDSGSCELVTIVTESWSIWRQTMCVLRFPRV